MPRRTDSDLIVAIDARIESGLTGGIESVLVGLATGLGKLQGSEQYLFVTLQGSDDWIRPHLGPNSTTLPVSERATRFMSRVRPWVESTMPRAIDIARVLRRGGGPPRSDGAIERAGAEVMHFMHQWGFRTGVPSIYHPHDLQHRHIPELFDRSQIAVRDLWYSALSQQAEMVAVASSWTREDVIRELNVEPSKVRVVPWASPFDVMPVPDLSRTSASGTPELPHRFVMYPAQTWPHKNHAGLLHALAKLRDSGLEVHVVFTGRRTPAVAAIDRLIDELNLTAQVTWLGFLEPGALRLVYERATAVVIPSRFEAASGPLWEAFAAGVPAACSNVTSLPRQAGDAALVFDPEQPDEIAAAVRRLWEDDALRQRLVDRGRLRVAAFTWDRTARMFRAHYRRIASRPLSAEDRQLLNSDPGI